MKFHHLAWTTTIVIGVQMVLAGIIVGEDAGLVCPSWPLCSTTGPIPVTGSLIFEMVHRFVALLLGVLVIWLLIWLIRSYRHNRALIWTCVLGLFSLLVQIVYAGLIVLLVLPGVASVVDVVNSVIMLSLFVHLANLAERDYRMKQAVLSSQPDLETRTLTPVAWILYAAGVIAVAAGAVFRHTGASQALFGEDSYIRSHHQLTPPSLAMSHALLGLHIATAVLLVIAAVWFAIRASKSQRLTKTAAFIIALIVIQAILGVASLDTRLELIVVTVHWAMAGLIMGVAAYVLSQTYLSRKPLF
ncbi:COX15/CtaA family protein [Alicyclobacillus mengziensis]|uniref:COX15/CtaA family protein n=1 Tax=Alicyclobacillus mengziensis TaxID=2931921 RepID=A0A9X7VXI6_9BACL|nr:COX15/CtaA family protein [Alicyclobacillus mengziensis]QSO46302.1 COX15/CtaA family protein [Alicyclobacillus mengziensis]